MGLLSGKKILVTGVISNRSPRLCTVGSLNLPMSHEAATKIGRREVLVSVPTSVSRNTLSSLSLNGLPCPM